MQRASVTAIRHGKESGGNGRIKWMAAILTCLILVTVCASRISVLQAGPIIIDHTCTDLDQIPASWIVTAKDQLRISYGHTSHGRQPAQGMQLLMDDPTHGGLYDFNYDGDVESDVLSIDDMVPDGDLGSPDRTTWATRTRDHLDGPGSDRNVVIWAWCGQVSTAEEADIDLYLGLMNSLEQNYPDVTFVYMTGHLDGTGETGNLNIRNNQIRAYCIANNKILYDFADIESYDPDGNYYVDRGASDWCYYDDGDGNWADEWCDAHPGSPLCYDCDCSHSKPLNCNLKGRAFWSLCARLAGWDPDGTATVSGELSCFPASGTVPFDFTLTATLSNLCADQTRRAAAVIDLTLAGGRHYGNWRSGWTNLFPGENYRRYSSQTLPSIGSVIGANVFTLTVEDVTPAPFNRPPYLLSGDTDTGACTVFGVAP